MTKWMWSPVMGVALLGGCGASVVESAGCIDELAGLPIADAALIDIEQIVEDIVHKQGAASFWPGLPSIATACETPGALPDQDHFAFAQTEGAARPIGRVRVSGLSGVVFAYPSRGAEEIMTGLAAAIVEYRPDGTPGRVYKAAELLVDEGWGRLTTSTLTATSIERCDQVLEYFTYSPEGDIEGELASPTRTPRFCEEIVLLSP